MWVISTFLVQPGREAEFEAVMAALIPQVRTKEPETFEYTLTKSLRNPNEYLMVQRYASIEAHYEHAETPFMKEAVPKFMPCLERPPTVVQTKVVI